MLIIKYAPIAQSVEQRTENPRVGGSIPPQGTSCLKNNYYVCTIVLCIKSSAII